MNDLTDKFPIGMRILAVDDDDSTCLKNLENLLLKCKYHVTTAQNSITAVNMLTENKNNLETDLPVIMFSENNDLKMVLKGITHGGCGYLEHVILKEVYTIWQHVTSKNKTRKRSNHDAPNSDSGNNGIDSALTGNSDQNERPSSSRKRKVPRVVWTVDLHRKFVSAVDQLGIDKAVPEKILDLMNVENFTTEDVARYLQKYRLYTNRYSQWKNQEANMAALSGSSLDTLISYSKMTSLSGSTQFHNNPFKSFASSGSMSSIINTPTSANMHGFSSSGTLELNHIHNDQLSAMPHDNLNDDFQGMAIR